jgi:hypothetical protein
VNKGGGGDPQKRLQKEFTAHPQNGWELLVISDASSGGNNIFCELPNHRMPVRFPGQNGSLGPSLQFRIVRCRGSRGGDSYQIYGFSHVSNPARTKSSSFKWGYAR